ncbi:hypothetical protein CH339_15395 [Rhodobium orientis]|uniref:Uncharacterized protein n=1 Tax=Rhodobium orientis TaxID=34017 RepID=A0A327JMR2_9HYPH|nr:hypothetical protein [Rhodobium orientis]RAI26152.1 hypothetical protein CH339_15395 [Rhodobium orientis]
MILTAIAFLAASLTGAASADYFWVSSKTDTGASAGLVGCRECDDIALWLDCDRATQTVRISLFSSHLAEPPTKPRQMQATFFVDDLKLRRAAGIVRDEMNAAWLPVVTINRFDPVLRRLVKGTSLAIEIDGKRSEHSLQGAEEHLAKMRRQCARPLVSQPDGGPGGTTKF